MSEVFSKENKEVLQTLCDSMTHYNFLDSYGIIILKNGFVIKVYSMFEVFHQSWIEYKETLTFSKRHQEKLRKETNDFIVTCGSTTIDLKEVSTMIASYKDRENMKDFVVSF